MSVFLLFSWKKCRNGPVVFTGYDVASSDKITYYPIDMAGILQEMSEEIVVAPIQF